VMTNYLYILKSDRKDTYYTGTSDNPHRRLEYHNNESKGYTQRNRPWKLVFMKPITSKEQALKAEQIVNNWKSKKMIRLLIQGVINLHDYL